MSWIFCRKSAARPEPRSALEPPGLAPFRRLFRFSASVDHQMTPALFRPLFRACALSRPSLADWLSGTPSAALRPKASHGAGLRERVIFLREMRRLPSQGASDQGSGGLPLIPPCPQRKRREPLHEAPAFLSSLCPGLPGCPYPLPYFFLLSEESGRELRRALRSLASGLAFSLRSLASGFGASFISP